MPKKKPVNKPVNKHTKEITPNKADSDTEKILELQRQFNITAKDYKYHATFCPTWRTELDCGDHETLEEAQQAIVDVGMEFEADVIPAWHRETPDMWVANGRDGQVDTTLTIARIVCVSAE